MKNNCPNINDKQYKSLASKVGTAQAHTIYARNNGNPISLTADGKPSLIYKQLEDMYGQEKAVEMRSRMFTSTFLDQAGKQNEFTMDKNGAIELKNGTVVNITDNVEPFKAKKQFQVRQDFVETGENMEMLIKAMETALPGFNIQRETFATLSDTPNKNHRAFVDSKGIHMNMQAMHFDTPVHEITHVWIHALEVSNPTQYNMFMDKVKESMNDNKELVQTIKQKYPNLTDRELHFEYAATVSGITSVEGVKKYLNRNNHYVDDMRAQTIWTRLADIVRTFYNNIRGMMSTTLSRNNDVSSMKDLDFQTATINDIFQALTHDIVSGQAVVDFGYREREHFMDKYYSDNHYEASANLSGQQSPIVAVAGIMPYLMNRFSLETMTNKNEEETAQYINDHLHRDDKNSRFSYWDMNVQYFYDYSMTPELRKQRIKEEIIGARNTFVEGFNDKIIFAITQYKINGSKDGTLPKYIVQAFDGQRLQPSQINEIINALKILGIESPLTHITTYKALQNDSKYSHLYDSFIASNNFNPLIMIHTDNSGTLDISVVDLAAGNLGRNDNILSSGQFRLGDALGADKKAFTYGNAKSDIRKTLIAMTVAALNKKAQASGQALKIRKMGVVGFNNFRVATHIISNSHEAFRNARTLLQLPQLQALFDTSVMSYKNMMDMIEDDKAWDSTHIMQSWRNIMESYYATYRAELGLTEAQVEDFMKDESFLRERQKQIERQEGYVESGSGKEKYFSNPEHKLISIYLLNKKYHIDINNSQMKDIDRTFYKVTNPHNIKHDAIQMFSRAAEDTKSIIINQLNEFKDEFTKYLDASLKSHGKKINLTGNKPEDIFGHLYRTGKIKLSNDYKKHKAGETIDVRMTNRIHGSYDLVAARAAGLTDADIALADWVLKKTRERYIENLKHNESMGNNTATDESIIEDVDKKLGQGIIPVLPQTRSEVVRNGKFLKAVKQNYEKVSKGEYASGEMTEENYRLVNSMFIQQMDLDKQLLQMGLEATNQNGSEYTDLDMNAFDNNTQNLEYIMNMFMHDGIRKTELENRLLPTYNNVLEWLNYIKYDLGKGQKSQQTTELFLEQYYQRIVERKNNDQGKKYEAIIRNGLNMFSFVALGYRPVVWMRSGYYNLQNATLGSIASMASNINTEEARRLKFPTPTDVTSAHAKFFTDFAKIHQLGKKFSIINSSEMDAIESIFTTSTDRHMFRSQLAQLGNYYTDMASRLITMTAFMIRDGSYDAHGYDIDTNTLTYDRTKDKRFFKDGKWVDAQAEMIFGALVKDQVDQGLATSESDMIVGYDFGDANDRFKWYSDKYIIGSMDEYQKVLLGNTAFGAMATQFRNYLPDKAFNFMGSTRMVSYGAVREVAMNGDNELEVIKRQIMIEGTAASMWGMLSDVYQLAKMNQLTPEGIDRMFAEMDPMRKHNLGLSIAKGVFFALIVGGLAMMAKAGLSDRDRDKLQWTFSELLTFNFYEELMSNLIPISSLIDNVMSLVTGQANWTRAMKYTGPVYDTIWLLELLTDKDDILQNYKTRKRVSDMNKKELEAHVIEVKAKRDLREKLAREQNS